MEYPTVDASEIRLKAPVEVGSLSHDMLAETVGVSNRQLPLTPSEGSENHGIIGRFFHLQKQEQHPSSSHEQVIDIDCTYMHVYYVSSKISYIIYPSSCR